MVNSTLVSRLVAACDELLAQLEPGDARSGIEGVRERLLEPLRIAVGGRLKAGKSTLVNALLGRRMAATAAGECTQVVAWYRYGLQDRIEVVSRTGERWTLPPAVDGGLPADLNAPAGEIDHLVVWMSARSRLEHMTLIDTPGLFSLNDEYSGGTRRFLGVDEIEIDVDSRSAVSVADGLLYLMPRPGDDDRRFLETFQALYPESQIGGSNVVGILSKIDKLGSGRGDPWPQARKVAANYERKLRSTVARVVPVAGLLAETAAGDAFTELEMRDLRTFADLDPALREQALESVDAFRATDAVALDAQRRARLLGFLDLYGLRESLRLIDAGATSAAVLLSRLRELSGIAELQSSFEEIFGARADPLRAHRALGELERIAFRYMPELGPEGGRLRAEIEAVRLDPALHFVAENAVLHSIDTGAVSLPKDYERELVRVAKATTATAKLGLDNGAAVDERARLALEKIAAWKQLENGAGVSRQQSRAARVIRESFEQIYFEAAT